MNQPNWWTTDEWATPVQVVQELERRYGPFDLDPCCRIDTAKAPRFFTKSQDGLTQPWTGRVFVNPPFSKPLPWLQKCVESAQLGATVIALLPVRTDTGWFHDLVWPHAELVFWRGRIRFIGWQGTPIPQPRDPSLIAVFGRKDRT